MKPNKTLASVVSLTLALLVVACNLPTVRTPTPTLGSTPTPLPPLPPQVIQVSPARGEEQPLDAPIQLVFDQAMDATTVEAAFVIEPAVKGDFEWVTERMVQFKPRGGGFARATRYTFGLRKSARSAAGLALKDEFRYRFHTVGFLEVATVQPADGATEVATDATVTVMFNRPVVPLTAIENQADLPQPLSFEPPVEGTGEWLNTSIYLFTPKKGFEPATTYRARIAAGLSDTTGGVLAEEFAWTFTTVMPAVVAVNPANDTIYVSVTPTVCVAFNQPMDHASAEAAFELKDVRSGATVGGTFAWRAEGLALPQRYDYEPYDWSWGRGAGAEKVGVETMCFTPARPLDFAATYRATIAAGARGRKGTAGTASPSIWSFDTIAYPRIVRTSPADGDERVSPWQGLEVVFSSPMDPASIVSNFTISPPVSETEVYTYWWDSDTHLNISFPTRPSSAYTVTIGEGLRGRYGHPLEEGVTVRWRTRAYEPMVYLNMPHPVGTYNAYTRTLVYVTVRNLGRVQFSLYRMPLEEFLKANNEDWWNYWDIYRPAEANLVRAWTLEANPPLNQQRIYPTDLGEGAPLPPGLYYLHVQPDYDSVYPEASVFDVREPERRMLVVSRYNLTMKTTATEALVWATDLRSGDVLPGAPVVVMDQFQNTLAKGVTDSDGVFAGDRHEPIDMWKPVFAFLGDPQKPGDDFAAASNQWNEGIAAWNFDLPMEYYPSSFAAYFFTDRPIYRPGQTVYFKGILRGDDDARYSLPTEGEKVKIVIWDPQGTKVFEDELPLNDLGTLHGELALSAEAALGYYSIEANYEGQYFGASFQVAEYRKPEFQVEVTTDRPEYVQGDKIAVTAQATYFFGGPVANAQVRYAVLSADYFFNYQGRGWWDFTDYDYNRWWDRSYSAYGERIAQGSGVTDAEGRFTFDVTADILERSTSQRFTLEVTVVDVNNQEVSNRTEAIVHKGLYYIGLRPERYVGTAGKRNNVNLITVDWASEPRPNQEVTVVFAEHKWYSVQKQGEDGRYYWESIVEDTPIFTTTATTNDKGEATVSFAPEKGGVYRVTARGLDERGNEVRSATYMWVSGRDYVGWRQDNNDRMEMIPDQRSYKVGETASILIPHPYQGPVKALITIERGHIYRHWVETLETNSEQIQIPITEDLIPDIFVSVVIVKGVDETSRLPTFKVGYIKLPIDVAEKELTITMTPDKEEHYQPGDKVTYDVRVTDSAGRGVEAELALNLVDLSVLTLADEGTDIVDYFWHERGVAVQTACGLTLSGERVNEQVAAEVKGMGGGGGFEGEFGAVRRRFPDTAYWNPTLRTDANGRAVVSVELPDNLTTWRMGAKGVTAETLVGQAKVDVISTKNLLVRPVAPRFFVVGDKAELAAVIHNNTDSALEVEVAFEAQGLQVSESANQRVKIPANDKVKVTWGVTAEDVEEAVLRFGARGGGLTDAVEIRLPVYRYSTPEVVATAGYFDADGQRVEAAVLPPSYDPTQGELSVHVDPSLAAGMVDGLKYLEHYPYECTEQTVSRFLPNVVTYRAMKELVIGEQEVGSSLGERLPGLVSEGLQRLYNQQHYDGGWGWWTLDKSDPFLTAYVLLGMIEAQRADFPVDDGVMKRAGDFLEESLRGRRDVQQRWQANRQAFIIYALAEAGRGDLARAVNLFERREFLDTFGKAYLALALDLLEPDEPTRVKTLLSDITNAAILSATGTHWEEAQPDYYAMNTDTRSTAIVLAALARLAPDHALAPNAVRWLMVARKDGYWETTQETAWAIIALTDWMVATGELEGAYNWRVVVNGRELGAGSVDRENIDETTKLQIEVARLLADEANRVVIERWAPTGKSAGSGRLYYSLYLRYFKPVEEVTALNRGVIVARQYRLADCGAEECPVITQAQVGDVIQVKLTIVAPHDLHYVVVEDPFPAGAEGVDQSLKTTSVVGEAPELIRTDRANPWWGGYGWWWFSHTEMRDEKAVLFATYLPRGTYEYTYLIRASLPGEFRAIPTTAYEMYFPEVFGRSDGGIFIIGGEGDGKE